jgi:hypothetical protein
MTLITSCQKRGPNISHTILALHLGEQAPLCKARQSHKETLKAPALSQGLFFLFVLGNQQTQGLEILSMCSTTELQPSPLVSLCSKKITVIGMLVIMLEMRQALQ